MNSVVEVHDASQPGSPHVATAFISTQRRTVTTTFRYEPTYIANPDAWPLGPDLPLTSQSVVSGLPGPLADTAPDRWGRGLIDKPVRGDALAQGSTPLTVTDLDYLLGVSDSTRQGALRYRLSDSEEFLGAGTEVPLLMDLPRVLDATDRVGRGDDLVAVKTLLAAGSASLGGARPKASVRDGERLLIAKFPHRADQWDVMGWEATTLDLARMCGIEVPAHEIVRIGERSVLLLERLDRVAGRRIPYVSGMTLLGKGDGDGADYIEVAEAMSEHGADIEVQLDQMWRRIAFGVAVNNTDDHLRNLGFLRAGGGWVLTPMFDVNPDPVAGAARATSIGWRGDAEALFEIAPYFDVNAERAETVWTEVSAAVSDWRSVALANGVPRGELAMFAPVLDARPR